MDITLHIGAHKTASTHLQQALAQARPALARRGVSLLGPPQLRKPELRFGAYLGGNSADPQAHAATLRAVLTGETPRLIVTEENILGNAHNPDMIETRRFYPRGESRLRVLSSLLPPGRVTIALAIRDPAEFLVSAYGQRLASGVLQGFEDYIAGLDPAELRWSELVERLQAAIPGAQWVVWRYEDYPANLPRVLQALAGPAGAVVRPAERVVHPGISAPAQSALMDAAPGLRGLDKAAVRAQVAALRERFRKGDFPRFDPFPTDVKARSAVAYSEDAGRIAALPGVHALWAGAAKG